MKKPKPKPVAPPVSWLPPWKHPAPAKPGPHKKPHKMTAKQYKQYLHWLKTHHFSKAQRKAYDKKKALLAKKKKLGLARPVLEGPWVTGLNDEYPTCMATAVANSLLLTTGIRVSDEAVLDLHLRAGGDQVGATAVDVLHELYCGGIGGIRPRSVGPGLSVIALGPHAAAVTPGGLVTWGTLVPFAAGFDDAWGIDW